MVYLAGDNNLTTECMFALTQMKQAAFGKHVNVVAQFDPCDPQLPTHRYHIKRRGKKTGFRHDIIDRAGYAGNNGEVRFTNESLQAQALATERKRERQLHRPALDEANLTGSPEQEQVITDDTDTGSPVTLYNFISFCLQEYPADHYLVVLSGHAGGTERDYLLKDESSTGSLTFNELKNVFRRVKNELGKPIDILGMDNCLMSMAEICYELRGLAEVVVGCESFSPASGWPYREVLERLAEDFASPNLPKEQSVPDEAAKAIVNEYVNYYANYWIAGLSVTQSALNVCKVERLRELIDNLTGAMEHELVKEWRANVTAPTGRQFHDALLLAHWEAQSYNGEQFADLYDFCDCLEARMVDGVVAEECRAVKDFLRSEFVLSSCYSGAAYQYSYGVSLYFPWSDVAPSYWNLEFVKDSNGGGWGSFLKTYTLLTRRAPRGLNTRTRLAKALNGTIEEKLIAVRASRDRMASDRMASDRMASDRMASDRMASDRMASNRMTSNRMASDRMTSGVSRNYIHSMRNPPNVFFPDECLRKRRSVLATQEMLRLQ
jgi:pentapeptide MXKDX repeat protein